MVEGTGEELVKYSIETFVFSIEILETKAESQKPKDLPHNYLFIKY